MFETVLHRLLFGSDALLLFVCLPEENLSANNSNLILEPGKQIGGFLSSHYMTLLLLYKPFLYISIHQILEHLLWSGLSARC